MKITKQQLKQIIKEELEAIVSENVPNPQFRRRTAAASATQDKPISSLYPKPSSTMGGAGARHDFDDHQEHQELMKNYKRETRNDPDKDPAAFVEWAKGKTNLNYAAALAR